MPLKEIVADSTRAAKDWQLKLLKEMPDFTANKTLTAEKMMPGLNVTEQDMGNNKLFSRRCMPLSAAFILRCINSMHKDGYISIVLASFLESFMCPS